jgi:hypothetical protein
VIVIAAIVLLVLSVPLAGGQLSRLAYTGVRHSWLVLAAFAVQTVVISVAPRALDPIAPEIQLLSYAVAAVWFFLNRRVPGLPLVAVGGGLNFIAIAANGGTMPAGAWATRVAGIVAANGEFANSRLLSHPRLLFLGDVFAVPKGWPFANVFSIGDIVLVVGVGVLLHTTCRRPDADPSEVLAEPESVVHGSVDVAALHRVADAEELEPTVRVADR